MDLTDREAWTARTAAILDVARRMSAAGPAPLGRFFFDIDHPTPTPLALVDELAARGIFRKYEHVLDLGGGLGASTRYIASRLGCTATATARTPGEAAAGRTLTARAALDWHVFHAVADATRLPFAEAAFTHVWVVDVLAELGPTSAVLAEAFRVLRPGGHLGLQEIVDHGTDDDGGRRRTDLERAGFVEVVLRVSERGPTHDTTQSRAAWAHLARRLGPNDPHVRRRDALEAALTSGTAIIAQRTARRP